MGLGLETLRERRRRDPDGTVELELTADHGLEVECDRRSACINEVCR